jgi:hypothetical protein
VRWRGWECQRSGTCALQLQPPHRTPQPSTHSVNTQHANQLPARTKVVAAALIFDAIEDGDGVVDWREGFGLLRDAAQALGNLNTLDYMGIG